MRSSPLPAQHETDSGSPDVGEPDFLVVGKLGKPHGIRGEIVMDVYTDFPERLQSGMTLFIGPQFEPLRLSNCRPHRRGMLVSFEGYQDRAEVAELRNQLVHVPAADRPPLPEGEYYHHQLLGLQVIDESGESLGRVEQILGTGANDVYLVRDRNGEERLVPATTEVILDINLEEKFIRVQLLPGL
jgi:16S rRNA processing protein RimM